WIGLGVKGWFGQHVAEPLFFYRHHFESSLSLFAQRLDPIYKAYLYSRRPSLYSAALVMVSKHTLSEMPPGWHAQPPMRNAEQLKKLLEQHPKNKHVLFFLGCAQAKSGATADAANTFNQLLTMHPNDIQAREALNQLTQPQPTGLVSMI